jgi:hypothetical protein
LPPAAQIARTLLIVVLAVGVNLGLWALLVALAAWRPARLRGGAERLRTRPFRSFVTGLLLLVAAVLVMVVCHRLPGPAKALLALTLLALLGWFGLHGLAMVAHDLGERVLASVQSARQGSSVAAVAAGGGLLVLVACLPLLGLVLHLVALTWGLGAVLTRAKAPVSSPSA